MNIAMMVRGYIPVPRPADMIYAPIDLATAIADGLVKRGHHVDFYAPMGSSLNNVDIQSVGLRPLTKNLQEFRDLITNVEKMVHYFPAMWEGYLVNEMFQRAKAREYDILHFHHPEIALQLAALNRKVPVVYTLHDPITKWQREVLDLYNTANQHYISISNNQRRDAPDLPYVKTVYNGVNLKAFPFSADPEDYLLYAGRIAPQKGVREAIQVAKAAKHRLLIIGPVYPDTQGYFDQYIKPKLDDQILYLGYIEQKGLARYYQKAKALLTPVQWEEPFGLTTIEAMASGTPVISFRRGAAPEIIADGKTGYVIDTTAEMIEAVRQIKKIKREDCRKHVSTNFSINQMINGYENAYEEVIASRKVSKRIIGKKLSKVPKIIRQASQKKRLKKIINSPKRPK
jgi:glycosyltransferase involved in cell wall biosynthesis